VVHSTITQTVILELLNSTYLFVEGEERFEFGILLLSLLDLHAPRLHLDVKVELFLRSRLCGKAFGQGTFTELVSSVQ